VDEVDRAMAARVHHVHRVDYAGTAKSQRPQRLSWTPHRPAPM